MRPGHSPSTRFRPAGHIAILRGAIEYVCDSGEVRRYNQVAEVQTDGAGRPVQVVAWDRTYQVAELVLPHWEEQAPWWTEAGLSRTGDELTVRHFLVRAVGPFGSGVMELTQCGDEWRVIGVWD